MLALLPLLATTFAAPSADATAAAGASVSAGGAQASAGGQADASAPAKLSKRRDKRWIHRWAPERGRQMGELGIYGGVIAPARNLELFQAELGLPRQGFAPLSRAAFDVGARLSYLPLRFFGFELEGGAMPARANGRAATMWTARGHLIAQLGLWSVTPFALVGASALGVSSDRAAVGNDVDAGIHFGVGVKFFLTRYAMLRVDLRDTVTSARGVDKGATNTIEALLGLSLTLGRARDVDRPARPQPQPEPPADRDGDGVLDRDDQCIDVPGDKPTGCPPPPDRDGDGFRDPDDACPEVPGIAPDGCPDRDPDKDGILDPDDACPDKPETKNGFEDGDGCPDEVPGEFGQLEVLQGVFFDTNKDTLRPESRKRLDEAVAALTKHASVRVEVSGHTDSTGNREHNMELSQRRADAVKRYLVEHGIDAARIETRGAGPDEPLDTNASKAGRAQNRRIEFRVLR
ncbi:MAG: OmpA family protein [Nannocystaceae bacterium]|nr:OmpA family protein [Nannocystaceae bacterium]